MGKMQREEAKGKVKFRFPKLLVFCNEPIILPILPCHSCLSLVANLCLSRSLYLCCMSLLNIVKAKKKKEREGEARESRMLETGEKRGAQWAKNKNQHAYQPNLPANESLPSPVCALMNTDYDLASDSTDARNQG